MSSSLNIILFGESGVGKSSVINLVAGYKVAETSSGVASCTLSFKEHSVSVLGRSIHIWDTVGLDAADLGQKNFAGPIEQACDLISQLAERGGVDLLLFCMRAGRLTETAQSNYRLFYEVLCRSVVPIALVITHLENEDDMESWWRREAATLEKYGIKAAGHACVTGLPMHSKYVESKENIARLLQGRTSDGRFTMPPVGWFVEFLRLFGLFSPLTKSSKRKTVIKILKKRCRMDQKAAEEVADKLERRD